MTLIYIRGAVLRSRKMRGSEVECGDIIWADLVLFFLTGVNTNWDISMNNKQLYYSWGTFK